MGSDTAAHLAVIFKQRLDDAGRDIESAASLDPNNSIIRSHPGKVYCEEEKTSLDECGYAVARGKPERPLEE